MPDRTIRSRTAPETICKAIDSWIRQQIQAHSTAITSLGVHFEDGTSYYIDIGHHQSSFDLADLHFSLEPKEYKRGGHILAIRCASQEDRPSTVQFLSSLLKDFDYYLPTPSAHSKSPPIQELSAILEGFFQQEGVPIPSTFFW